MAERDPLSALAEMGMPFDEIGKYLASGKTVEELLQAVESLKRDGEWNVQEDDGEWRDPEPFDSPTLTPFPIKCLPKPLAAFTEHLSISTQTPPEMCGLLSLGILSTLFQSKFTVQVRPDWSETLCLYLAAVAPPAERKSAVLDALVKPIREYEMEMRDLEAVELARNRAEYELLQKEMQAAQTAAAKGNGDRDRVWELSERLATFQSLHPFRLLADDTTQEKLIELMSDHNGTMSVYSAEGGLFDIMRGRYSDGVNIDVFLKSFSGEQIIVDRIGRKHNDIPNPRLSLLLAFQPEVLNGLMGNTSFRGRGLCGRFLYAMCQSKIGHRDVNPDPIPDDVKQEYHQFVKYALSMEHKGVIQVSDEADALRADFQTFVEEKLSDEWSYMQDWGGKLTGAMVRIAALFHIANTAGDPTKTPISGNTMASASCVAYILAEHAALVYQTAGANSDYEDARYLWKRIQATGWLVMKRRDLFNLCKGKFQSVDAMLPALNTLVEMGYIRRDNVATGGRPSTKILVNPFAQ